MPEEVQILLHKWWVTLRPDDIVTVRYPHDHHGLMGKTSNRQDAQVIEVITALTQTKYKMHKK